MITNYNSNVSFKGFDNIFAGRQIDGKSGDYAISMRLNNEGTNDLDRFKPLLDKTTQNPYLTIHYNNLAKGQFANCPEGVSYIDINGIPLMIEEDVKELNLKEIKEVEKTSMPLTKNIMDLLKRVEKVNSTKSDHSIAPFVARGNVVNSLCGMIAEDQKLKNIATEIIMGENYKYGDVTIIKENARTIIDAIANKMIKYFK